MVTPTLDIPRERIDAFCRKWRVRELSLFGSAVRGDFSENSDVDVLVSFEAGVPWNLWDWPEMRDELQAIFGREVDLVEKEAIRNPFRRREILNSCQVVYAA